MRLFIALELPDSVKSALSHIALQMRQQMDPSDKIHWVAPESFHITVKFLGDCKPEHVEPLKQALRAAARITKAFELRLSRLGCFPARGKPLVLWAGGDESSQHCADLAKTIERLCEPLGFKRETRRYHPHITLARVKWSRTGQRFRETSVSVGEKLQMKSVSLMESELTPAGAHYTRLSQQPFSA